MAAISTPQHPELLLVGYYTNPNIPHDPDGVVLMWDLKFQKDTPDYIFNCQVCCNQLAILQSSAVPFP